MNVRKDTQRTIVIGPILDSAGAAKTDEVVASVLASKNGGNPTALDGSATLTHKQTGYYLLLLTANDINTLGCLEISLNSTTNTMPIVRLNVMTALAWDAMYAASGGVLMGDLRQIMGTSIPAESVGGRDAAALGKFLDVASPVFTAASVNQGADVAVHVPQVITMAQIGGVGAYYVEALNSSGAVIAATGGKMDLLDTILEDA